MSNKHHIVPCCYLWNFAVDPEKKRKATLHVYDKTQDKSWRGKVEENAFVKGLYEVNTLADKEFFEKLYGKEEGKLAKVLRTIIRQIHQGGAGNVISPKNKLEISEQIFIQLARVPEAIDGFSVMAAEAASKKFLPYMKRFCSDENDPAWQAMLKQLDEHKNDQFSEIVLDVATDRKAFSKYVSAIMGKVWTYWYNTTATPFITSDTAAAFLYTKGKVNFINDPSVTVYYPIAPDILIYMIDAEWYKNMDKGQYENRVLIIDDENHIKGANALQYSRCKAQLYGNQPILPGFYALE